MNSCSRSRWQEPRPGVLWARKHWRSCKADAFFLGNITNVHVAGSQWGGRATAHAEASSALWGWRVGFTPASRCGDVSDNGPCVMLMGADALMATTPQLPADAGARWPRRLQVAHGHSTITPLLGFRPRSPLSLGTSPLQQEQLGVRFWLFWFLAGLGIRKGNRATHTTPTPRTEPQAGKASSVCVHQRGQRPFHLTTLNTLYQNKSRVICKCLESICLFILLTPYSYWWEKNFY